MNMKKKKKRIKNEFDLTKEETDELIDLVEDSLIQSNISKISLEAYFKLRKLRDKKWEKLQRKTNPSLLKQWNQLKSQS